jgi:hypothetical protein
MSPGTSSTSQITEWTKRIPGFDRAAAERARAHQGQLTKPPGSLGRLEELAVFYAGVRGQFPVAAPARARIVVFAADHGVTAEGVSPSRRPAISRLSACGSGGRVLLLPDGGVLDQRPRPEADAQDVAERQIQEQHALA